MQLGRTSYYVIMISGLLILWWGCVAALAFADTGIDFEKCYSNTDHHCMVYLTSENSGNASNPNWHVTIVLPHNGAPHLDGVFSNDNFTSLKQNPAIMYVGNIYSTTNKPTLNYCPTAKIILSNQDTYIKYFYNATENKDITNLVYPNYCFIESGSNPIDGHNTIPPVPEFGDLAIIALVATIASVVIITRRVR